MRNLDEKPRRETSSTQYKPSIIATNMNIMAVQNGSYIVSQFTPERDQDLLPHDLPLEVPSLVKNAFGGLLKP